MEFRAAGLRGKDSPPALQPPGPAGMLAMAGGPPRLAIIFVIHGPAVKARASEFIHERIFAMAGHIEVEYPRADRGAANEEQHGPGRLAGVRRAEALAIHPQGSFAFLGPVLGAPD